MDIGRPAPKIAFMPESTLIPPQKPFSARYACLLLCQPAGRQEARYACLPRRFVPRPVRRARHRQACLPPPNLMFLTFTRIFFKWDRHLACLKKITLFSFIFANLNKYQP
ncbi:MAG: hypothetical protein AB1742_07010, partial [bacterium]